MSQASTHPVFKVMDAVIGWAEPRTRGLAWASLIANIVIVATGGAVRLTASGLGCPTWPLCTDDSLVNTPEMGMHGLIEFANRLLTFVLIAIALASFLSVYRSRHTRPDLFRLTFTIGTGIILQAIVGGITVLLDLQPGAVGIHFLISAAIVAVAATLVHRITHGVPKPKTMPRAMSVLLALLVVSAATTIILGTLTTGSGPHAGDAAAARNGLDPIVMQHLHAWPSYILLTVTVVLLAIAVSGWFHGLPRRFLAATLVLELFQIVGGIAQSRLGLPSILVGAHMVLACALVATLTWVVLSTRVVGASWPKDSQHAADQVSDESLGTAVTN